MTVYISEMTDLVNNDIFQLADHNIKHSLTVFPNVNNANNPNVDMLTILMLIILMVFIIQITCHCTKS